MRSRRSSPAPTDAAAKRGEPDERPAKTRRYDAERPAKGAFVSLGWAEKWVALTVPFPARAVPRPSGMGPEPGGPDLRARSRPHGDHRRPVVASAAAQG